MACIARWLVLYSNVFPFYMLPSKLHPIARTRAHTHTHTHTRTHTCAYKHKTLHRTRESTVESTCSLPTSFTCRNGDCVSPVTKCDRKWDCTDASDEFGCCKSVHSLRMNTDEGEVGEGRGGEGKVGEGGMGKAVGPRMPATV